MKLLDEDRQYLAELVMADDEPAGVAPELLEAVRELTAAVRAMKPEQTAPVDTKAIADAISSLHEIGARIDGLRSDIGAISSAIAGMSLDTTGLIRAINENTEAQRATAEAILTPRTILKDQFGEIRGIGPKVKN